MNIPNLLTLLRVLLIPIFILLFYLPTSWSYLTASAVFALAAATDWLDGYLARRLGQSTPFGAFLDPVADKLMVAVALVLLVEEHANLWLTLPAVIIIGREIVVSALREWMAELGARAQVAVSNLGKWKTAAQMLALTKLQRTAFALKSCGGKSLALFKCSMLLVAMRLWETPVPIPNTMVKP